MSVGTGVLDVGRVKKKTTKPVIPEKPERETVIHMKGSPEYVAWLERVHRETRIPKVQIFRQALEEWATTRDMPKPPEI